MLSAILNTVSIVVRMAQELSVRNANLDLLFLESMGARNALMGVSPVSLRLTVHLARMVTICMRMMMEYQQGNASNVHLSIIVQLAEGLQANVLHVNSDIR